MIDIKNNNMQKIKPLIVSLLFIAVGVTLSWYVVNNPTDKIVSGYISYEKMIQMLYQHMYMVGISLGLAIITSVPIGIILTRNKFRHISSIVLNIVNIGQTIPSLAVIALFVGVLGIGIKSAIFALWVYSLLPILSNTIVGIDSVDSSVIEAARGMGMSPTKILLKVELPLSLSIIIAGIRTALIVNIGNAILGAFVGAGGFGELIISGNSVSRLQMVVLGASIPVLMAILADYLFGLLEDYLIV